MEAVVDAPAAEVAARVGGWARVEPLTGVDEPMELRMSELTMPLSASTL